MVEATQRILKNWPTLIVLSQPGVNILTGENLGSASQENPVREAYFRWFNGSYQGRSSWDPITVLYAIRPSYFIVHSTGSGSLQNGFTYSMEAGWRSYISKYLTDTEYKSILNKLMIEPPKTN